MLGHRPIGGQVWAPLKLSCVHFSLCLYAPNFLGGSRDTWEHFRPLGRCCTPAGRGQVPKNQAKLSKFIGEGEVNISAFIRAPCTKFCLEVCETHRNISRPLRRC